MDDFEQYRPLLFSIAYQMLGSAMEAEDIVQEAFLRYQSAVDVQTPKAFLTTVVTRLCLNQLQSARAKRENYVGTWLPEPIQTSDPSSPLTPSAYLDHQEAISMAFLVLLEQLSAPERAVFLLREVFDYSYPELALILGKSETACRQLHSRAKKRIAEHRPRFPYSQEHHRQMLERFVQAVESGEVENLTNMLAQEAVLWADGAGRPGAVRHPILRQQNVAHFLLGTLRFLPDGATHAVEEVNAEPALVIRANGKPFLVAWLELEHERIQKIRVIANPHKLQRL